jgi:hypothetical protein
VILKNFFAESEKNCTWQRNSLPRVGQLALGKEIFGECSFLCRELFVCLSARKPVCQVFLLCREPNKKLSAKPASGSVLIMFPELKDPKRLWKDYKMYNQD